MHLFEELGVSKNIVKALVELGFETPSEIQKEAIPLLLEENSDFIGLAQTGTGKTAAFGLPLLDVINLDTKKTQGLVLAPTRELVQQIASGLEAFAKYQKVNIQTVYGGTPISNQIRALKRNTPHLIIATPGRLIDLLERKMIDIQSITNFVLDEADEMLNMGFKEEIDKILSHANDTCATWLFSATMPNEIKRIVREYMENPREVKINPKTVVNKNISHQYSLVRGRDKTEALKRVIDFNKDLFGITFCRTKMDTQRVAADLLEAGYKADALNGDLSQQQRDKVMDRFKSGKLKMLVATDVAARGIDVNDLTHVVHYDMPDDLEYYTHRSGRTARAGKKGVSIAFIAPSDVHKVRRIEQKLKLEFEKTLIPTLHELEQSIISTWSEGIVDSASDTSSLDDNVKTVLTEKFADFSKEEVLEMLAAFELQRRARKFATDDINMSERSRGDSGGRESKSNRFFINMGEMDGAQKGQILDFLCDNLGFKTKHIGNVNIRKSGSTFEVDPGQLDKIPARSTDFDLDGRTVYIKKDDQPRSGGGGGRGRGGRGGNGGGRNGGRGNGGGGGRFKDDKGRRFRKEGRRK
ncbi:DEAD/DEAH box helicase [Cyclobacteriaceae bacterium]|nr:DEAD/DEAH box helicase [Cyclobacteriaceae bacterium]